MKVLHPMALLLKYEAYPPAVLVAIFMHGLLLYFVIDSPIMASDFVDVEIERVPYINAQTAEINPQRLRRLEMEQTQQRAQAAEAQRQRDLAATRAREEQAAREQAEREAAAQRTAQQQRERDAAEARALEQRRMAEAEQQRLEEQARETQRREQERLAQEQAAREAELARQAAVQRQNEQAASDARNIQSYVAIIHDTVTYNWSIPPSARNGMTAVLSLRLVPTGEVIQSDIVRSSGDAAFDRSVLQAVSRAGRFPELQDMPSALFEANFRNFTLTFRPEDLLR